MTQTELNHAVSQATGDDLSDVSRLGFSLVDLGDANFDDECDCQDPQVIDWDAPFAGTTHSFHETL
jgi:hypothetical protein